MEYSVEELKKLALEEGFSNAGQLNLKALVFMPEVRQMCSADKCHAYGRNWRLPTAGTGAARPRAARWKSPPRSPHSIPSA